MCSLKSYVHHQQAVEKNMEQLGVEIEHKSRTLHQRSAFGHHSQNVSTHPYSLSVARKVSSTQRLSDVSSLKLN